MGSTLSPEDVLKSELSSLFVSKELADFTITCGPDTYRVHKAVLAAQSSYFFVACRRGFKEGENHAIDLETSEDDPTCDNPIAVKHMIEFFYRLDYFDISAVTHARVFAAAVKYQVPALRTLSAKKFKNAVAESVEFAKAIIVTYTTTAEDVRELRDIIVETINSEPSLCEEEETGNAVRGINGLAWELFRKSKEKPATIEPVDKSLCRSCKKSISGWGVSFNGKCSPCAQ